MPRSIVAAALIATAFALSPPSARAQDAPPPERVAPRLLEHVGAAPPEGLEDRDASVVLEIVVAVDGSVSDVRVAEGAGGELEAFDAIALEAARAFRFEPARVGETPVAARIRYRYVFEGRREVETIIEEPSEGDGDEASEPTDDEVPGAEQEEEGEDEVADAPIPVFRARAVSEGPPRDAGRRVLRREVLTSMPGTRGDALRVVELLPGVGRPAFGGGVLLVRGAAPGDSQVFLDGNPVPLLYHFGGLTSFYNSQLLNRIDFVPGNFSVRYGRKIGGILEVDPRDPRTDGYHGYIEFSVIDASILLEGPIGDNFAFAVAFRRSLIDLALAGVQASGAGPQFLTAPVYYDYQAIATWRPDDQNRVRFLAYGSSDELRLLLANPSDSDFAVRGNFGISTQFHRFQVGWRHTEGGWFEQDVNVGFGANLTQFNLGDALRLNGEFFPVNLRSEWRLRLAENVRTIIGLDLQLTPLQLTFRGPPATQSEGMPNQGMLGANPTDFSSGWTTAYRPAAYVESNVSVLDALDLTFGVRADWYREVEALTVDPRLIARVRVNDWLTLRSGVGLFSQPPEFQETTAGLGNPELDPIHALHVGLGTDFRFEAEGVSISLDGFYKHIWDRVISTPRGVAPFFVNEGLGRIYGLEVGARLEPDGPLPLYGFLSYTLSRSERQDGEGAPWRLFDFDQTHILTLALVWRIGDGWEAGATFRLVSGNPYTPVASSLLDVRTGTYRPIYAEVNSDRNPFFHRLDLRVQKRFEIGDVRLIFSIDVQNVYNATNREGLIYNYDYTQSQELPGLPIIPSLGLRGEI